MKIFETEDDGKIGDLLYKTVEFTRQELVAGGVGVISQGAVLRYLEAAKPDLKIKKCGSFKLDSQKDTVTMRIGIADTKLLNPGYDELKAKYDALVEAVGKDAQKFSDLLVENENLKKQVVALADCAEIDLTSDDEEEDAADLADAKTDGCEDHLTCVNCQDRNCEGRKSVEKMAKEIDDNQKPLGQNSAGEYSGPHGSD